MIIGFGISPSRVKASAGVSYDADAQAFFTAASITDTTQKNAVNQLVLDLKSYNIWTKMIALYPIVGGNASSHAVNLKTPGTYNLSFSTGWTHASTGMTGNGTSAYADTSFNQTTVGMNTSSTHLSFYSRSNTNTDSADIGVSNVSPNIFFSILSYNGGLSYYGNNHTTQGTVTAPVQTGLFLTSRTSSTLTKFFRNGSSIATNTSTPATALNRNIWIGARSANTSPATLYGNKQCAFASIGTGLTDTESANFYTAVQAYQTTLSRNV